MTDLTQQLRDGADAPHLSIGQAWDLLGEAADALEDISSVLVDKDREIECLREIPCLVESPDGNPGWSTIGDAVKLLAAARRERDEALANLERAAEDIATGADGQEADRLRDALESVMRYCEELTRGTTHYEGCADDHPYCKIWSIAQQAIAREAPAK